MVNYKTRNSLEIILQISPNENIDRLSSLFEDLASLGWDLEINF